MKQSSKYSWLWLGLLLAIITLSAIDFVLLMVVMIVAVYFIFTRPYVITKKARNAWKSLIKSDLLYLAKAIGVFIVLAGYRFVVSYIYVSQNPRPAALLLERRPPVTVLLQALFVPIGTIFNIPTGLQWGWGEYSMYMGMGVSLAFLFICLYFIYKAVQKKTQNLIKPLLISFIVLGVIGFLFAIGDFGKFSPYHILRSLPGYSSTRVSSRWLFLTSFAILIIIASWKKFKWLINILLLASAIELFVSYGPPSITGSNETPVPNARLASMLTDYNNGRNHLDANVHIMDSYYYTTSKNVGQIYTDEPFADTLDKVMGTDKCASYKTSTCSFVLSHNAKVTYWSPNKILIKRTAPGNITLNMNVTNGWRVNGSYPYGIFTANNPNSNVTITGNSKDYTLIYSPKISPSWFVWRLKKI
jgi:hypothetical protein